jgi:hypothetical protein
VDRDRRRACHQSKAQALNSPQAMGTTSASTMVQIPMLVLLAAPAAVHRSLAGAESAL